MGCDVLMGLPFPPKQQGLLTGMVHLVFLQMLPKIRCKLLFLNEEGVWECLIIREELVEQQIQLFDGDVLLNT